MNELEGLREERDALAAHVKRLSRLWLHLVNASGSDEQMELMEEMHDAIRDHYNDSDTSLARLKAQWQAEALEKAMREVEQEPDLVKKGLIVAAIIQQLRRQAEEH